MAARLQRLRRFQTLCGPPLLRAQPPVPRCTESPALPCPEDHEAIILQASELRNLSSFNFPSPPLPPSTSPTHTFYSHLSHTCVPLSSTSSLVLHSLMALSAREGGTAVAPTGQPVEGMTQRRSMSKKNKGKQGKGRNSRSEEEEEVEEGEGESEEEEESEDDSRRSKKGGKKGAQKAVQKGASKGAKAGKSKQREGDVAVPAEELVQALMREVQLGIETVKNTFKKELSKLRTGRATPDMLDHVLVEAYHSHVPLSHVASVTVKDPQCLSVTLHDSSLCVAALKGLQDSPMGLTPSVEGGGKGGEGSHIFVPVPRLTNETRQAMVKLASQSCEAAKVGVRRVRKEGMDGLKGADLAEDELKRFEKKVEALVAAAIKELDSIRAAKEKDIGGSS